MTGPLRLAAPAKLNLSLAVVGRRADGFHELAATLVLLDLEDDLRLEAASGPGGLEVIVDRAWFEADALPIEPTRNLAWRGLLAGLAGDAGDPGALALRLEKRIPAGAGLGGGSSDAAAAWRLARGWLGADERPTGDELREMSGIGADVPFFAAAAPAAYVRGIGEWVEPLRVPIDPPWAVLALPPFRLSTAAVFAELRPSDWSAPMPPDLAPGRNDLLPAARRLRPELDAVFDRVRRAGGEPHLSGSGSTVFSLTDDPERAAAIAKALAGQQIRAMHRRVAVRAASIAPVLDDARPSV